MNKGYIYVASLDKGYLKSAIYSAESLRDYYPEANITLFTHEEWVKDIDPTLFNNIITENIPYHKRAKLWALDKTPYDLTVYIDSDMEIMHENISKIFDEIPEDKDIMLCKIRSYASAFVYFDDTRIEGLTDHCGLFLYRKNDKTMKFMKEWWELYQKQTDGTWVWDSKYPYNELRPWDQWTYWWLQNKTDFKIERGYFENDAKWNFINTYRPDEANGEDIIIYHHTVKLSKN